MFYSLHPDRVDFLPLYLAEAVKLGKTAIYIYFFPLPRKML
jgi:hypothetical protein